jgi:hypothetical protein
MFVALALATPVCAQSTSKDAPKDISKDTSINDLKTKIFDAKRCSKDSRPACTCPPKRNFPKTGDTLPN